jgi:hypothetical protein
MLGLKNLKNRLNYMGGANQEARMNIDKLRTLRKALLYSYQAATVVLPGDRKFRCLMNPNKLSLDYDEKIISIPFEDVCLDKIGTTAEGLEKTNLKVGDVFEWKENGTHWIVTLKKDEETAYFRGICRKCRFSVRINDKDYWVYIRGPVEQSILWAQKNGDYFNKLNYSLIMYITQDENTSEFFERFQTIKLKGKPWEVQAVDSISSDGIIEVALKETYTNNLEDSLPEIEIVNIDNTEEPYIKGSAQVKPFDIVEYSIENVENLENCNWIISNKKAAIKEIIGNTIKVEIISGRSGSFTLTFVYGENQVEKEINILSL